MHVHFWPGDTLFICGLLTPVKSARLLATGDQYVVRRENPRGEV